MSALVLMSRSRVPQVGRRYEWIQLGSAVMKAARKRKGLSYEAMARLLNMSTKQYWRWEKDGKVPLHEVIHVASILELELEMPESVTRIILPEAPLSDEDSRSLEILRRLARIEDRLGIPPDGPAAPPPLPDDDGRD